MSWHLLYRKSHMTRYKGLPGGRALDDDERNLQCFSYNVFGPEIPLTAHLIAQRGGDSLGYALLNFEAMQRSDACCCNARMHENE